MSMRSVGWEVTSSTSHTEVRETADTEHADAAGGEGLRVPLAARANSPEEVLQVAFGHAYTTVANDYLFALNKNVYSKTRVRRLNTLAVRLQADGINGVLDIFPNECKRRSHRSVLRSREAHSRNQYRL